MNHVQELFELFLHEIENNGTKKIYYAAAESLYKDIVRHEDEINDVVDVEEILRSSKTKKEKKRDVILMFYDFLKQKTAQEIQTDLPSKIIIDDPLERLIAVVQYIQVNSVDIEKISSLFMLSDKSMREVLNQLEDGVDILGTRVQIKMGKNGWERHSMLSYHPVFLNLTMPEVTALTAGLLDTAKENDLYGPLFRKIARNVYDELTEYGKGRVTRMLKAQGLGEMFSDEIRQYEEHVSSSLITMLKEEWTGTLHIQCDGVNYIFTECKLIDYGKNDIIIETKEGDTKKFRITDIYACEYNSRSRFECET